MRVKVAAWVGVLLQRMFFPPVILISDRQSVRGITLVDLTLQGDPRREMEKVRNALAMIDQHDPRIIRRMARDVRYLLVSSTAGTAGEYWEHVRSIVLDQAVIGRQLESAIAMTIVHEAMHARLWRMGVGRFPDRGRIEGVCVAAEIRFAEKVPGTEAQVEGAHRKLASRYWEKSRGDAIVSYLDRLGLPRWCRMFSGLR